MNETNSVGDVMSDSRGAALRALAIFAGVLVYCGALLYSGVHNWRLMLQGVAPDMVIWAALGVISLEISALALPVALHFWTHSAMQRIAAFAFYGVDLAAICANVILDYAIVANSAGDLPGWLSAYLFYGVPATPILAGLGWSLLLLLDPSQRERAMVETLKSATREALARRIAAQARQANISAAVDQAAAQLAAGIVGQTLGVSVEIKQPTVIDGKARDLPSSPGPARRFWRPAPKNGTGAILHAAEAPQIEIAESKNGREVEA